MSDHNWCHGPECHTYTTQSRIRGSGRDKVLRTIKIKQDSEYLRESVFSHFCNQRCLMDFIRLHKDRIVALAPRRQAQETPIQVKKEKYESQRYEWNGDNSRYVPYTATRTTIKSVDNT